MTTTSPTSTSTSAPAATSSRLFVGNLHYEATSDELAQIFAQNGHTTNALNVVIDRTTGKGKGFAFADFRSPALAAAAVEHMTGFIFRGRPLRLDYAHERKQHDRPMQYNSPSTRRPQDAWGNAIAPDNARQDDFGQGRGRKRKSHRKERPDRARSW